MRSPRVARNTILGVAGVALLLAGVVAVFLWEPWHGPVILALSQGHGFDAGDLPALPMVAAAVAIGRSWSGWEAPQGSPGGSWALSLSAIAVGAALLLGGAVARPQAGVARAPVGGGTFGGDVVSSHARDPSPVHRWTHVAATYDGAHLRLYVNGTLTSSQAVSGSIKRTDDPLWIGGNRPYGEYFRGLIDDVRVYDRALRPRELSSAMSTPVGPAPPSGLVAAYGFDQGRGAVAVDSSGRGHAGSIVGATWEAHGRFGGALRFRTDGDIVRVPASASLDLTSAMTLAAWVEPTEDQSGWRTIVARQTDAYFLMASGGAEARDEVIDDDLVAALLVGAAIWFCLVRVRPGADESPARRRSWWQPIALFLAGSVVDALAPPGALVGPMLVAAWFGRTASGRAEATCLYIAAGLLAGTTVARLAGHHGLEPAFDDDGGIARALALGLVLVMVGVFALPPVARRLR